MISDVMGLCVTCSIIVLQHYMYLCSLRTDIGALFSIGWQRLFGIVIPKAAITTKCQQMSCDVIHRRFPALFSIEVPIGFRNFGIPKLSIYRFDIWMANSYFFGQFRTSTAT